MEERIAAQSRSRRGFAAQLLSLKDFAYKLFELKDLAGKIRYIGDSTRRGGRGVYPSGGSACTTGRPSAS